MWPLAAQGAPVKGAPKMGSETRVKSPAPPAEASMSPESSPSKSLGPASPSKSKNRKRRKAAAAAASTASRQPSDTATKQPSKLPVRQSPAASRESPVQVTSTGGRQASEQDSRRPAPPSDNLEAKQREEALREQVRVQASQLEELVGQVRAQAARTRELEAALAKSAKMYGQVEKVLESELSAKASVDTENQKLTATVARLRQQVAGLEKSKFSNEELIRVLNATLMERETEISILKLKLTRFQTNLPAAAGYPSLSVSNVSHTAGQPPAPPTQAIRPPTTAGGFERNSLLRSTRLADAASVNRAPPVRSDDRDSSIWAKVPAELTPSKRPQLLERNMNLINDELNSLYGTSSSNHFERDRRYKTLPRSMKSPSQEFGPGTQPITVKDPLPDKCQVTNLDDSNSTSQGSQGNRTLNLSANEQSATTIANNELAPLTRGSLSRLEATNTNYSATNGIAKPPPPLLDPIYSHPIPQTRVVQPKLNNLPARNKPAALETNHANNCDPHRYHYPNTQQRMPARTATAPIKFSTKVKKLFHIFKSSSSSSNAAAASATNSASKTDLTTATPLSSPFRRGPSRSTMLAAPCDIRAQMVPSRQAMSFHTDKPFAVWDTDMLVDWLTMIGLSMYASQCKRWVKCGADILDATPMEVDKGLGITNHLHRKKLRLAISELNGDCDKITKAAAKLDYLWVARWLDDIGLPQYKESFINARVDGRVLNYLTVEDLISLDVKSVLHHVSIKCGIRVLRSIQFDLQLLKRRATADEIEQMSSVKQNLLTSTEPPASQDNPAAATTQLTTTDGAPQPGSDTAAVALWTCHRVMEWLRLIDFAEFSPNLRGSGVHGGLIVFELGFSAETMCALLCIPASRTLLRRHLFNYFKILLGPQLAEKKRLYLANSSNQPLNPSAEIKTSKRSQPWFSKIKSSIAGQEGMDEYLCPMSPVNQQPLVLPSQCKSNTTTTNGQSEATSNTQREADRLSTVPESVNV